MKPLFIGVVSSAVVLLGQLSEDLGLFGHAVWYDHGKSAWRFACYAGVALIVAIVYEVGEWHGRRRR